LKLLTKTIIFSTIFFVDISLAIFPFSSDLDNNTHVNKTPDDGLYDGLHNISDISPFKELIASHPIFYSFLRTQLYQATGYRLFLKYDMNQDAIVARSGFRFTENSIKFPAPNSYSNKDLFELEIKWVSKDDLAEPMVEYDKEKNTLLIPKGFDFESMDYQKKINLFLYFLAGHSLHPYMPHQESSFERKKLGEEGRILKYDQKEMNKASRWALYEKRQDSFFFGIATVGFGKTQALFDGISTAMEKFPDINRQRKLIVVFTNKNAIIKDQIEDFRHYISEKEEYKDNTQILKWGDEDRSTGIKDLISRVDSYQGFTVLFTSTKSLISNLDYIKEGEKTTKAKKANIAETDGLFISRLALAAFDEGHHIGGKYTFKVLNRIFKVKEKDFMQSVNDRPRLILFTATPYHLSKNLIDFVKGRIYLTYVDTALEYMRLNYSRRLKTFKYSIIFEMFKNSMVRGENTPLSEIQYVDISGLEDERGDVVVAAKGEKKNNKKAKQKKVNKKYLPEVIKIALDYFGIGKNPGKLLAFFNITSGAKDASEEIARQLPEGHEIKIFHQKKGADEIKQDVQDLKDYKAAPVINASIGVHGVAVARFDEGMNVPGLNMILAFLNINPSRLLQRIGRGTRLAVGVRSSKVLRVVNQNGENIKGLQRELEALRNAVVRIAGVKKNISPNKPQDPKTKSLEDMATGVKLQAEVIAEQKAYKKLSSIARLINEDAKIKNRRVSTEIFYEPNFQLRLLKAIKDPELYKLLSLEATKALKKFLKEKSKIYAKQLPLLSIIKNIKSEEVVSELKKFVEDKVKFGLSPRLPSATAENIHEQILSSKIIATMERANFQKAVEKLIFVYEVGNGKSLKVTALDLLIQEFGPIEDWPENKNIKEIIKYVERNSIVAAKAIKQCEKRLRKLDKVRRKMQKLVNELVKVYKDGATVRASRQKKFEIKSTNIYGLSKSEAINFYQRIVKYLSNTVFLELLSDHPEIKSAVRELSDKLEAKAAKKSNTSSSPKSTPKSYPKPSLQAQKNLIKKLVKLYQDGQEIRASSGEKFVIKASDNASIYKGVKRYVENDFANFLQLLPADYPEIEQAVRALSEKLAAKAGKQSLPSSNIESVKPNESNIQEVHISESPMKLDFSKKGICNRLLNI